jgi:hypothetical protein
MLSGFGLGISRFSQPSGGLFVEAGEIDEGIRQLDAPRGYRMGRSCLLHTVPGSAAR